MAEVSSRILMNDEDWTYQDGEFDEGLPYIELQFGSEDVSLIYKSICFHLDKWPGGHAEEQERIKYLKDFFFRVLLEYKFQMDE